MIAKSEGEKVSQKDLGKSRVHKYIQIKMLA